MNFRTYPALLLILLCLPMRAQQDGRSFLIIPRGAENVPVVLDGTRLAPGADTVGVEPGMHVIERISPDPYRWTMHRVIDTIVVAEGEMLKVPYVSSGNLVPREERSTEPAHPAVLRSIEPSLQNGSLTLVSAVAMVGSSIAAAFLKIEADRALDEYRRTNSAAALAKVRRYDRYSAVASAAMVISFSGFALLLTSP